jgi:hypothetical protein
MESIMKNHRLLIASVWNTFSQRDLSLRLPMLVILIVLLALSGSLTRLAPACQARASASCFASVDFTPQKGVASLPSSDTLASRTNPLRSPPLLTHLPAQIDSFLNLALPYALQAHKALGWQTSVILAQWGLEQGWHVPSYTGYNWGNVGPMPGVPTVPGISTPGSPSAFSYAATPADGERVYIMAARLPYYDRVFLAAPHGATATAIALGYSPWDAGHYTNTGQPGSSLLAIMQRYNLFLFDYLLP